MRLEHLCDIDLRFAGEPVMVRAYGAQEGVAYADGAGRVTGERLNGVARLVNFARLRSDGVMLPDIRGILTTPEGVSVLFTIEGLTLWVETPDGRVGNQLMRISFVAGDERYRWLNHVVCVMEGKMDPVIAQGRGNLEPARVYMLVNELLA
jgi:hypothetical protein